MKKIDMKVPKLFLLLSWPILVTAFGLHEVHSSSWSGGRVRHFALSSIKQASDVLQCAAPAAKHLLADQLLVFIPQDGTQQPQCILANRSGSPCRRLTPHTQQSPCCIRVFVTSLSDCWISIQRRVDNSTDFYRNWSEYAVGFGDGPHTNHWLGLRNVHSLTWPSGRKVRFRMVAWNNTEYWADYSSFIVASESDKFRLSISGFEGSHQEIRNSMAKSNGMMFSTFESDNDVYSGNCCQLYKGGWWYGSCHETNPNGVYFTYPTALNTPENAVGIVWRLPFEYHYSMKEFEIAIL